MLTPRYMLFIGFTVSFTKYNEFFEIRGLILNISARTQIMLICRKDRAQTFAQTPTGRSNYMVNHLLLLCAQVHHLKHMRSTNPAAYTKKDI